MKPRISNLRQLPLGWRLLIFAGLTAFTIFFVSVIKPVEKDAYTGAAKNQLYWIGTTLLIGYFAVLCFGKSRKRIS